VTPVEVLPGDGPVILGQPHGGTWIPDDLATRLNATGRALADTDWHISRLYVIDANRDPAGASLYPGQNTTGLCPVTDFDGNAIWQPGQAPSADEIETRRATSHAPYHTALAAEVERIRARHGLAILYDCHSIRSRIPFLFPGTLPTYSIGTNDGATCAGAVEHAATDACPATDRVLNGRFKGGWTTRHYGQPGQGVHAIQMELAQRAYLAAEAAPWTFDAETARPTRAVLQHILETLDSLARSGALT